MTGQVEPILSQFLIWIGIEEQKHTSVLRGVESLDNLLFRVKDGYMFGNDRQASMIESAVAFLSKELERQPSLCYKAILGGWMSSKTLDEHAWHRHVLGEPLHSIGVVNLKSRGRRGDHAGPAFVAETLRIRNNSAPEQLTPSAMIKLILQLQGTNWRYNRNAQSVDLFRGTGDEAATGLSILATFFISLFPHQREGIEWILNRHSSGIGGILADSMGMGKTRQVLTSIFTLFQAGRVRRVLVLCPPALVKNWANELSKQQASSSVFERLIIVLLESTTSRHVRNKKIQDARKIAKSRDCHLLVISSDSFVKVRHTEERRCNALYPTRGNEWDWIVLDEAHRAKNGNTYLYKALRSRALCSQNTFRLMLTATPIQNKLEEYFRLIDWATVSRVIGSKSSFDKRYGRPIEQGLQLRASLLEKKLLSDRRQELQDKLAPFLLKWTVNEELRHVLPAKKEFAVLVGLSQKHRAALEILLRSEKARQARQSKNEVTVFSMITRYRMSCMHPFFTTENQNSKAECYYEDSSDTLNERTTLDRPGIDSSVSTEIKDYLSKHGSTEVADSSLKLEFCADLLGKLTREGHKTLVFSESRKHLDFLEHVIQGRGIGSYRVDGTTKMEHRQEYFDDFNGHPSKHSIMLLTIGVGGLGLTLIGASRVIHLSPVWNPTVDAQAVGRAYRIGQKKSVTVYRIITAGTVEEKIYWKQVHKDGTNRFVETLAGARCYFDKEEMRQLLTIGTSTVCESLQRFPNAVVRHDDPKLAFISKHKAVVGILQHDGFYDDSPSAFGSGVNPSFGPQNRNQRLQSESKRGHSETEDVVRPSHQSKIARIG